MLMTMEQREEVRRHDKQRRRRVHAAKYIDVETNDGAAGRGAVAGEGAARDKRRRCRCVDTTDDDVVIRPPPPLVRPPLVTQITRGNQ